MKKSIIEKVLDVVFELMLYAGAITLAGLLLFGWVLNCQTYLSVLLAGLLMVTFPMLYVLVWIDIKEERKNTKVDIIGDVQGVKVGVSTFDNKTMYFVGDEIEIENFDLSHDECSTGFHFFCTLKEAENY